jgi:hypothetical protein
MGLLQEVSSTHPGDFNAKYNDALKTKQAIESQQLNQQSVQMSLAEKQRQAAMDKAQSEALMAQYGGANAGADIDMTKVADIIKLNAIKHGDPDRALAADKIARQQKDDRELTAVEAMQMGVPVGSTVAIANAILRSRSIGVAGDKAKTYSDQVQFNKDKFERTIASYAPGGFEPEVDPVTKQAPTKQDADKFRVTAASHGRIHLALDNLEASLSISDGNDPNHPEFMRQKAFLAEIAKALKEKENFGAALTGNEQKLNSAGLPQILSREDMSATGALIAAGLGRDAQDAVNVMRAMLSQDFDLQLKLYKFKRKQDMQGLPGGLRDSYSLPSMNGVASTSDNTQAMPDPNALAQLLAGQPNPQPTPTGPPAPQVQSDKTPEEIAYKEQHLAKLRAQAGQ